MDAGQISTVLIGLAGFVLYLTSQLQQRAKQDRAEVKRLRIENGLLWRRNYRLATLLDKNGISRPEHEPEWLRFFEDEENKEKSNE